MYRDWASRIAARVQRRFDDIEAVYNFDLGDEFEIAVAELLQEFLPSRAGVCRGFVVTQNDEIAGDDIIVFDRVRFPTMRLLGQSLALKEHVPLEAVLAYIEAKHTLYLEAPESDGQSLAKASEQVRAVSALTARQPVSALQVTPHLTLAPGQFAPEPRSGYFDHRNPLYCAVYARNIAFTNAERRNPTVGELETRVGTAIRAERAKGAFPSVIAAGELLVVPTVGGKNEVRPVLGPQGVTLHGSLIADGSMGLAIMHLLSAIEQFELGPIPWDIMLAEAEVAKKRRPSS